jgi:hypothetical protein
MKKPQSPILNKSNDEGCNWEKKQPHKKNLIKKIRVETEIKNKFEGI